MAAENTAGRRGRKRNQEAALIDDGNGAIWRKMPWRVAKRKRNKRIGVMALRCALAAATKRCMAWRARLWHRRHRRMARWRIETLRALASLRRWHQLRHIFYAVQCWRSAS
jgi:hypothetical protein